MSSTDAKMDVIVNEGLDRLVYPGASYVEVSKSLPEYRGGVTMTIRVSQLKPEPIPTTITIEPSVRGGVPCVGRQCWPISHILQKLGSGVSPDLLTQENPDLNLEDIQLALDVASWVMRDPAIDWPALDLIGMANFQAEMEAWQGLTSNTLGYSDDTLSD